MMSLLAQQSELAIPDLAVLLGSPLAWGLAVAAFGLWIMIAAPQRGTRRFGEVVGGVGLIVLAIGLPAVGPTLHQTLFWLMALTAVGSAAIAVSARNPVYTAVWFALSLLGVAGLFLFQQAQFLGVATVVVYAGAILVTFLFVLMLAQPDGHASYDRLSWSRFAPPMAVLAATLLVGIVLAACHEPLPPRASGGDVLSSHHMARLGSELFARHLIAVEVAGTLLLVALVGAIAIVIHGRTEARPMPVEGGPLRRGRPQSEEPYT
jgi:NADH-quinone oxidoreductase subunit J